MHARGLQQSPGSVHSTVRQGSPAAGKGRNTWSKSCIWRVKTGAQERRLALAGFYTASTVGQGQSCTLSTPIGEDTPPASPILLPGGANPKGMKSRCLVFAASWRFPITTPRSWTWTTQPDAPFIPRGSSTKLGVEASLSQPCSDSILYFSTWQIPSVVPMFYECRAEHRQPGSCAGSKSTAAPG